MKAVINEKETPVKDEYPKLMVSSEKLGATHPGRIVLFTSPKEGTLLSQPSGGHYSSCKIGEYDDCWNIDIFTPFTGSITLSND